MTKDEDVTLTLSTPDMPIPAALQNYEWLLRHEKRKRFYQGFFLGATTVLLAGSSGILILLLILRIWGE